MAMAPIAAPTPIPAFAPVERPVDVLESVPGSEAEELVGPLVSSADPKDVSVVAVPLLL
jgi:hypothetical protein